MDDLENIVAGNAGRVNRWSAVGVIPQAKENADTEAQARAKWNVIYGLFGARGESEQDEVFAAVNMYFLMNGCSPSGKYRKEIKTAGGRTVSAGEVVKVVGGLEGEIRQFLRGRLADSYAFLKYNHGVLSNEELHAAAFNAGIPRELCWLMADWLGRDCPYFVGDEAVVYNRVRTSKIAAAHAKKVTALDSVDHVVENAPEAKMMQRPQDTNDHGSLF